MKTKKIINWLIVLAVVVGIIALGYRQYTKSLINEAQYVTTKVERGDLLQTVSATGTINPLTEVKLNFLNSGKITVINIKKGDKVNQGDILVEQDSSSFDIAVEQAQANLTSSIATLSKLKAGASSEDIKVIENKVASAQTAYDNAIKNLNSLRKKTAEDIKTFEDSVDSSETALDDKKTNFNDIDNKYSQNIKNIKDSSITIMSSHGFTATTSLDSIGKSLTNNSSFTDQQVSSNLSQLNGVYLVSAQDGNKKSIELVSQMKDKIAKLYIDNSDASGVLNFSINTLNNIKQTLIFTYSVLQNTVATSNYTQAEIDLNKTEIDTRQIAIESAISGLQTAQQNLIDAEIDYDNQINSAQSAVNLVQDNLTTSQVNLRAAEADRDLKISNSEAEIDSALAALNLSKSELAFKKAPPRRVDLASQEAQVLQYRAALALAKEDLDNTTLISPIDGVVTKSNYEVGEQSSLSEPVVILVTEGNYEIEVDISEADIVKVEPNDLVDITFDSLGEDEVFIAKVIFIDPAQTVISDVVYYKVKIVLEPNGNINFSKIKPGMTANVDVMTDKKNNILVIPQRAIQQKNGKKYVKILERRGDEQNVKNVDIEIGLNGDGGLIEVISGLSESQEVVTFVKNGK